MAMGTIADNIKPDHEQASTPRFPQPGVLVVPSGPASTHATGSNRQVAANPAQIHRTAARQTAIKRDLSGSRLLLLVRHADTTQFLVAVLAAGHWWPRGTMWAPPVA